MQSHTQAYKCWASDYETVVGKLSQETWQYGIIEEIKSIEIVKGKVLDAGAGTGIGAKSLKELGNFHVASLDQSPEMLELAKKNSDEIIVADLNQFSLEKSKFDVIVSGFNALNYLNRVSLANFFQNASNCLKPSGYIIFDYSSLRLFQEYWENLSYETAVSQGTLLWNHQYNYVNQCSNTHITLIDDNKTEIWSEAHIQYSFDVFEIYQLAKQANLTVSRVRDIKKKYFSPSSYTYLYVIQKLEEK